MKRFIFTVLCVSIFFVGVGTIVDKAGAKFKSDEKALELVRQARIAIGGDSAIAGVQSLRIVGQTTKNFKGDGVQRTETGETEIALQLPDKLMRMTKIGHGDENSSENIVNKRVDVTVVGKGDGDQTYTVTSDGSGEGHGAGKGVQRIIIKKPDGTTEEINGDEVGKLGEPQAGGIIVKKIGPDKAVFTTENGQTVVSDGQHIMLKRSADGDKAGWKTESDNPDNMEDHHVFLRSGGPGYEGAMRHNELLRLTLSLLLTAPQGMDVSYTFGGEGDVDGNACNIVVAEFAGSSFKIYLSKSSNLPVQMSYTGVKAPQVFMFRTKSPETGAETKDNMVFTRKLDGAAEEKAEYTVKFSDYRSVGGVQLPYKWTQTAGGAADETFDVTSYEVNPANISEKFQNQKVMVRTRKPDGN
ncbi:MAG: hypothetical protein ABJB40_05695 [Acidobacteriota bacterium]